LSAARTAVSLVPNGFDANRALGDALAANGDWTGAKAAYGMVMGRLPEMETSAQQHWRPILERRMAEIESGGKKQ
jgi:hypothetical protein